MASGSDDLGVTAAETNWTQRVGRRKTVVRQQFLDFTINARPLRELAAFAERPGALGEATRLSDRWPAGALEQLDALLGTSAGSFEDGRVALLVCQICGDLGCRALSAELVMDANTVQWRDLDWQDNNEPYGADDRLHPPLSFRFDRVHDEAVLMPLRDRYASLTAASIQRDRTRTHPRRTWRRGRGSASDNRD